MYLCCLCFVFVFFFFKQKTAYEMRISDWSSDVCSSDLMVVDLVVKASIPLSIRAGHAADLKCGSVREDDVGPDDEDAVLPEGNLAVIAPEQFQIGRASCRERVCQYV